MMGRCAKCLSVGLVCTCLLQGVKAPPASVISWIVSPGPVVVTSSTASINNTMTVVNTLNGKFYDVGPVRQPLYGEHATGTHVWPPPDRTKT